MRPSRNLATARVLVMDSSRIAREALCELLSSLGFLVVAAAGAQGSAAIPDHARDDPPGLLISRITSDAEARQAAAAIREIRSRLPGLKTVILADGALPHAMGLMMQSGVDGVLSRHISSDILKRSLELVLLGQRILPAQAAPAAPDRAEGGRNGGDHAGLRPPAEPPVTPGVPRHLLSRREQEILQCLMTGMSNKSIARTLEITEATVKVHVKGVLRKTGLANRTQLAIWAIRNGAGAEQRASPAGEREADPHETVGGRS